MLDNSSSTKQLGELKSRGLPPRAKYIYPIIFLILVLLACQGATVLFKIPAFILPPPSAIATNFFTTNVNLWKHLSATLIEATSGFSLAIVVGLTLAFLITRSQLIDVTIYPYLIALSTIPILAIAPLLILWFGFGLLPKIIVSALICFLPIVINTMRGLRAVDYRLLELMQSLSATEFQVYRKIRVYAALPYTFAALKVAVAGSLVGAVVGEFLGSDTGLGYLIVRASTRLDTTLLFMAIVMLVVLGVSEFLLITLAERKLLYWYEGSTTL